VCDRQVYTAICYQYSSMVVPWLLPACTLGSAAMTGCESQRGRSPVQVLGMLTQPVRPTSAVFLVVIFKERYSCYSSVASVIITSILWPLHYRGQPVLAGTRSLGICMK